MAGGGRSFRCVLAAVQPPSESTKMNKLLWLFAAGGCGSLARYWLSGWIQRLGSGGFPWGTFVVNLAGCLLFGIIWTLADDRMLIRGETRFIVLTGFVGAFTTFSTFAFESQEMLRHSEWVNAAANILGQNILGIAGVILGIAIGKQL
jgi:fluoride exporter